MFWEEMTAEEFKEAVRQEMLCVIPMGVIEKHGSHLPLGTDMMIGRSIAKLAAQKEKFVIFPYYFFGQINEAMHVPGTIAVSPKMQMELLQEIVEEISRNGFKKIVLLESHGGNINFLNYFMQSQLRTRRTYTLYKIGVFDIMEQCAAPGVLSEEDGHAALTETEFIMACRPELVHMERVNPEGAKKMHRLEKLGNIQTPVSWYCDHPTHQDGDPSGADPVSGQRKLEKAASYVAKMLRIIKEDDKTPDILKEYYAAGQSWIE